MNGELPIELELTPSEQACYDAMSCKPGVWLSADWVAHFSRLSPRKMRLAITSLRQKVPRLLSGPQGYKLAETQEEVERFKTWMLSRACRGIENYAAVAGVSKAQACNDAKSFFAKEGLK